MLHFILFFLSFSSCLINTNRDDTELIKDDILSDNYVKNLKVKKLENFHFYQKFIVDFARKIQTEQVIIIEELYEGAVKKCIIEHITQQIKQMS